MCRKAYFESPRFYLTSTTVEVNYNTNGSSRAWFKVIPDEPTGRVFVFEYRCTTLYMNTVMALALLETGT